MNAPLLRQLAIMPVHIFHCLVNAVIGKVESGPKPVIRLRESSGSAREADEVMRSDYTDFPITLEISFRDP
jgi:hypothetical protein